MNDFDTMIRAGAKSALRAWHHRQPGLQEEKLDDLISDLWLYGLERQGFRSKIEESDSKLAKYLVRRTALQLLSKQQLHQDTFNGKQLYSSEAIKDAMKGRSTNKYLMSVLPTAMAALDKRGERNGSNYAEVLRRRYIDGEAVQKNQLWRAHQALTEEINILVITTGEQSWDAMPAESRSASGGHSDPTGDTAILLMDNPELRDDYLEETTWDQICRGAAAEPVYRTADGKQTRPTGWLAGWLQEHPELQPLFTGAQT